MKLGGKTNSCLMQKLADSSMETSEVGKINNVILKEKND